MATCYRETAKSNGQLQPLRLRRTKFWALWPCVLLVLGACGRETKIYPDPHPATTSSLPTDPTITIGDGRNPLPKNFFDQSVNQAKVDIAIDGVSATSTALRLQTFPTTNAAGGFNGSGTGNRALLGQAKYSQTKLSALGTITFDTKIATGTEGVSISLIVDLDCTATLSPRVLIADSVALAPGTSQPGGYSRMSADVSTAVWQISGASLKDPSDASIELISALGSATHSTLTSLLAKYPNACVRNLASGDDSFPKNIPTAGVIFTLGDGNTTAANSAFINRITIGSDVYDAQTWGQP